MTKEKNIVASRDTAPIAAEQATILPSKVPCILPDGYLANGYHATTDKGAKYLRPEFVGEYAKIMADLLAGMKSSDFNRLLGVLRRSKASSRPYEDRYVAALEMLPKAMSLVARHKAPPLLISFIEHNIENIHEDSDWFACLRHFEAIAAFHAAQKGGEV